ncbi:tryptophan synthase subunit beta [Geovibrio thiophilus]|uniref:Tryptophan synthase beta chain n=1 Tax=Geovibrio thiophilus TaxID=139438 RepID=A0A3R5UYF2_9BACT|nr:tryptophan synthase subunit beta [Geovibrio thiophilus]QAR32862.1 tryptophan synthase subunit beta [Geovibrio thiophilus]
MKGFFGDFGGMFVPETLVPALEQLEREFNILKDDPVFTADLQRYSTTYIGRPSPVYYASRLSEKYGTEIYLKREDLNHTGSHKINNTIGQALLTRYMGKKRIIAETGAGQHGVATATVAALFGLDCTVYMGAVDAARQKPNVDRMKLLGAKLELVHDGSKTLKDATNAAMRDWVKNVEDTHYIIGSVIGPHPFPEMVAHFQSVIGREARASFEEMGFLPDAVVACVGGGSNAIGIFKGFLDAPCELYGIEAGGLSDNEGDHAMAIGKGRAGILHGCITYLVQTADGQVADVHSVAAGLDYPGIGPEHSYLHSTGRVIYDKVRDEDAVSAFRELARREGIVPAVESSHAIAYVLKNPDKFNGRRVLINLSGRGDKDSERDI